VETSTLVRKGYDRNCNSLTACTLTLTLTLTLTFFLYTMVLMC
jgi:hypothetical protein